MDEEAVFKRYDIRGEFEDEIDERFATLLGKSIGTLAKNEYSGEVTVCRDNKMSSTTLKRNLIEGIRSTGADIYDAGNGPTDYAALTGRRFRSLTVQVTSSHLPLSSNGFKLMYPEGNGFRNEDLDKVEDIFKSRQFASGQGNVATADKASKQFYRKRALSYIKGFPGNLDGRKIVVETLGGAGRELLPELLEKAGAEVIDLSQGKPEGPYFDPPEPDPERLEHLAEKVEEEEAYLGLATDMDADRLTAYFKGSWLTGDELFAVFAQLFDSPKVVGSIDTSKAIEDVIEKQGGEIEFTRVGDPFVISRMLETEAVLAGEPNGHYCFPEFVPYNSGVISGLILAKSDLRELLENIPKYHTSRENVEVDDKDEELEKLAEKVKDRFKVESEIDGVKYVDGDAIVLVRSSGSSPILRVKADSKDKEEAVKAAERAIELIRKP